MTTTPTVWKAEVTVNAGNTTGFQDDALVIGLSDDRILTVWFDNTNNVDDKAGTDIIGQIFDARGNPDGAPFLVNVSNFLDDEKSAAIAALPDGGFVMAYQDRGSVAGDDAAIRYTHFSASGVQVYQGTIAPGTIGGVSNSNPSITVLANGDFVVGYQNTTGGNDNVLARVVDIDTHVVGSALTAGQNGAEFDGVPDIAALSNGNFATASVALQAGMASVEAKVVTPAGANVGLVTIAAKGTDPHIAALGGGKFAVVWWNPDTGDVMATIRNSTGGVVKASFVVQGGALNVNEPDIVALRDGGFFISWDDDSAGQLRGARFSATGAIVGTALTIVNGGSVTRSELGLADDGRILVAYHSASGEVGQVILDPRDETIIGTGRSETITSRIDGATVNGNGGNDVLLGMGAVDILNGKAGNDTLVGGTGADVLRGGVGNDLYVVNTSGDTVVEASGATFGNDTVLASASFVLTAGAAVEVLQTTKSGASIAINLTGNGFANILFGNNGNNILDGGGGIDQLTGLLGNDSYRLDKAGDKITETIGGGSDTAYASVSYILQAGVHVETLRTSNLAGTAAIDLTGNALANVVVGNAGANRLKGAGGNDRLDGKGGHDVLVGGGGIDRFAFTTMPAAANSDRINDMTGADFIRLDRSFFSGIGITLNAAEFRTNTSGLAQDGNDRVIYETDTGKLFYDRDGAGGVAAVQFAILAGKPAISHLDFEMVA